MESRMIIPAKLLWLRPVAIGLCLLSFFFIYAFQHNWLTFSRGAWSAEFPFLPFSVNRTLRLIVNDGLCLVLFVAIFNRRDELKLASFVFLIELLVILPIYLFLKLSLEGDSEISSPLLSFVHRLIVNPLLMFILLAGLLFQQYRSSGKLW